MSLAVAYLNKYKDRWYVFYHTMSLQNSFNTDGGFRSVCVDEIKVDEDKLDIAMADQTLGGPAQLKPLDPFAIQQAATTVATKGGITADSAGHFRLVELGSGRIDIDRSEQLTVGRTFSYLYSTLS